jgi:branched-chain amino acid transport system permease protein
VSRTDGIRPRWPSWLGGAIFFITMAAWGGVMDNYFLSLLTIVFLFGFLGHSWSLMMGLGGQLSIGHALFVGIGAYSVAVVELRFGITPWLGLVCGMCLAAAVGALMAWLSFRFDVRGIYFALLTIAAAEFTRVVFSGWDFIGGMQGLFFPAPTSGGSLLMLRGDTRFYYYISLILVAFGAAATSLLRGSFLGFVWRAMRDDEDAARALGVRTFRHKILVTSISAAMAAFGGGIMGLVQGSIFPDSIMGMQISVDILIGPIVGGLGTAFGPLIGALAVIPINHAMAAVGESIGLPGLGNVAYGLILIAVMWLMPGGIWPTMASAGLRLASSVFPQTMRSQGPAR